MYRCSKCGKFIGKNIHSCEHPRGMLGKKHTDEWKIKMKKRNNREGNPNWKGGKHIRKDGYILIKKSEHPKALPNGYIYEHILIMENYLGRFLKDKEEIHHINGNHSDNRLENLKLFENHSQHCKEHNFGK